MASEKEEVEDQLPNFKIRSVQRRDMDILHDIEMRSFKSPFSYEMLRKLADYKNIIYLVGELDDKIIGYTIASLHPEEAHLISIVVEKKYQRRGFGTIFLQEIIKTMQENSIKKIVLEVRVGNEPARKFYAKFNFKPVKTKVRYYTDGEDALEMELTLP